jgi:hypothetical protein
MDDFNLSLQKIGQHIYQGAGAASGGGPGAEAAAGGGSSESGGDNVVDADYREV